MVEDYVISVYWFDEITRELKFVEWLESKNQASFWKARRNYIKLGYIVNIERYAGKILPRLERR